jgi:small subunit ribosomal protein S2
MERKMGGIKNMIKLPGAIFAISTIEDSLAIKEAQVRGIPVVALVDTNVDPAHVDYPIPANEDAVSSLKLLLGYIGKAIMEGKGKRLSAEKTEEKK